MKKLVTLLTILPLVALADMAPMSRDEWERHRQFLKSFDTPFWLGRLWLPLLAGVLLSVCLLFLMRQRLGRWRCKAWMAVVSLTLTSGMISCCMFMESALRPFSTLLSWIRETMPNGETHEETYEEYLFYESHCRRCGTGLAYYQGRYCPKCHPRKDNSREAATKADKFQPDNSGAEVN